MSGGVIARAGGRRLRVAVLGGGRSGEHEVSLVSAASVCEGVQAAGHEPVAVEIGRDGVWRLAGEPLALTPAAGLVGADVVFPALHGPGGEDGTVQGVLETLAVPYVGSGVAASALCLDKVLFKRLMSACGVPQVRHAGVRRERWGRVPGEVRAELAGLGLPVFVKPARMGSSVGIGRAASPAELDAAIDAAFAHDELVIVEAAASGVEVECGVLGTLAHERERGAGAAIASQPGEIVLAGGWYDYAAKYEPGGMELKVPAGISPVAAERVRELALRAFADAGCDGLARVDFFVDGEEVLLNELNTMPGFTPTSVYAKLLASSGTEYPELVDRLCRLALERHAGTRPAARVGIAT
jgi:D-alanine-D-alanine ligase